MTIALTSAFVLQTYTRNIFKFPEIIKNLKAYLPILCYLPILYIFIQSSLLADPSLINSTPIHVVSNPNATPSLVNSVDFHPQKNRFCVTFTHNHAITIYQIDKADNISVFQELKNPTAQLSCPQHAVFTKDGQSLIVANWCNQTFNVYHANSKGFFNYTPSAVLPFATNDDHRPHGIACSPDGHYLAVAFGASKNYPRAIALYKIENLNTHQVSFELMSLLQGNEITSGIPKGIAFSHDGSCLLITLSETNSVAIYTIDWPNASIISPPKDILSGTMTKLSRPEDIKFTAEGNYFAISNSDNDTISFYEFDKENNVFTTNMPSHILKNPEAQLKFPHGLAFSYDGKYLSITQFGSATFDQEGDLSSWGNERKDSISIYKIQ